MAENLVVAIFYVEGESLEVMADLKQKPIIDNTVIHRLF